MPIDATVMKLLYIITAAVVTGVLGIIFKLAYDGIKRKNTVDLQDTINKINWLHEAHKKTDDDGRPIWYFPQSLEKKFDKMINHLSNIEKAVNEKR